MRIAFAALLVSCLVLTAPAVAWKGQLEAGTRSIAEVHEKAESGDYVVVEGTIIDVFVGSGSRYIVTLEDGTGSVPVRVPEHLLRKVGDGRTPEEGIRARVGGKWTHAYMDDETWGIHAQTAERVQDGQ